MKIWKTPLNVAFEQEIQLPRGAQILSVQTQGDGETPHLWSLVNPENPMRPRVIRMYGTGNELPGDIQQCMFLGTFQQDGGAWVWHAFELLPLIDNRMVGDPPPLPRI